MDFTKPAFHYPSSLSRWVIAIIVANALVLVMAISCYTMGVLATNLFGTTFPSGSVPSGRAFTSLYSLLQIMTLESWSMGIVRPVMLVTRGRGSSSSPSS